jgi:ABC-type lipoprotein export system ATPase subunit
LILDNLNVEINEGDFIFIIGDSGAGKSTLINIIGLLEDFELGKYHFNNLIINEVGKNKKAELRNSLFGFVFQMYYLLEGVTCRDNILLPTLYSSNADSLKANEYLKKLAKMINITHLLDRTPDTLSGGEKQRVAIARALINQPRVLICDEPTGNLDEKNTIIIMDLLKKINKSGVTIIIVTHDLELCKYGNTTFKLESGVMKNEK